MPTKPKPMTVLDAYNKAKNKPKSSARENVTRSGQGSGNTAAPRRAKLSGELPSAIKRRNALGDKREKITRTGQGSGNTGPKKKNKGFFDRVGDIAKGVGRVGEAVVKDSINTVTNPFGAAKSTAQQIGRDVKNKNIAGLGLAAASMIPIPSAKGSAAAIKAAGAASKAATAASTLSKASKAAGKTGKAGKTLAQMADDAVKAGAKGAKTPKPTPKPKPATPKPTPKPTSTIREIDLSKFQEMLDIANSKTLSPAQIEKKLADMAASRRGSNANIAKLTPKELSSKGLKGVPTPAQIAKTKEVKEKLAATAKTGKPSKPAAPAPKPPAAKPAPKPAASKPKTKIESAQSELASVRKELADFKAAKGGKYKDDIGYKRLTEKLRAKEQKVSNAVREAATGPRNPRGVTQKTMTDGPVKAGDAQRTYSGVGRSNTPRTGVTESPKPSKGQFEGDALRGQARDDAARMSNRGLRGSSRATREGRTAENKARNVENIKIRENERKMAEYNRKYEKAKASKKPKDIQAAKKYAEFWGLKGIKRLK